MHIIVFAILSFMLSFAPHPSYAFAVFQTAKFLPEVPVGFTDITVFKIIKNSSNEKITIKPAPGVSLTCNTCPSNETTCYAKFSYRSFNPAHNIGEFIFENQYEQKITIASDVKVVNEPLTIDALLQYVAWGAQDSVIKILKQNPSLALTKGHVTDYSGRTFENITAFQYALWAYDRHMWQAILPFLPSEAAKNQILDLESKGTKYGNHFNFEELYNAYEPINSKKIKQLQRLVPVHVANEMTRRDRVLYPSPSFADATLPRNTLDNIYPCQTWFPSEPPFGTGYDFFYGRGTVEYAWGDAPLHPLNTYRGWYVRVDRAAIRSLFARRVKEYDLLKIALNISTEKNA